MRAAVVVVSTLAACGGDDVPIDVTCRPVVVYLNGSGGEFLQGNRDDAVMNISSVLDMARTLAPWPKSDFPALVDCMKTGLAPFPRLEVTEVDPGMTPHVEIVFTDTYWAGAGMTSLVPGACRSGHQIELVFGTAVPTTERACHVTLQGFALMTAQLSLNDNCYDLVNNYQDCSPVRSFVDQTSNCVDAATNQPGACRCGGGTTENTYQALTTLYPSCD